MSTRTIANALNDLAAAFAEAGLDLPRLDARVLISHVLEIPPTQVFVRGRDAFPEDRDDALAAVKARRLSREPVGRIRGFREFYGHDFKLGPDTLEPRPDSEAVVFAALRMYPADAPLRVLDLGTGTGCLLLAILAERPGATGIGIDLAPGALDIARGNAARLGLDARATFQPGNWCAGLTDRFDLIVANPPYIAKRDIATLEPEVARFDPILALDGGDDGLDAYRSFIPHLANYLTPEGTVLLEVGFDQAETVALLCAQHGLKKTAFHRDLAGILRVVQASAG